MTEEQIIELSSQIDRFEDHANFMRIYFKNPKDVESLKKSLVDLGIKDIIKAGTVRATATSIEEYMIEVNWRYSAQKKIIDDLEYKHTRIKAWSILRGWGGTQMTDAEQKFFSAKDARIAAHRLEQSKGM